MLGRTESTAARIAARVLVLFALVGVTSRAVADTIAVVVDTSSSMRHTDPDRVAVLATLVLSDLLDPSVDELVVVPFDPTVSGADQAAAAPVAVRGRFPSTDVFRDELLHVVTQDGRGTFFAPALVQALDVLGGLPARGGRTTIVLLTDGASLDPVSDLARLERDVLPRMRADGVQGWFVALGATAASQPILSRFFSANRLGGYLDVGTAADLPGALAQALARSTGRVASSVRLKAGERRGFDGGAPLAIVDVVGVGSGPVDASWFQVAGPTATSWSAGPGDAVEGLVGGGAGRLHGYRRVRVVAPVPGPWSVTARRPVSLITLSRYQFEVQLALLGPAQVPAGTEACVRAVLTSRVNRTAAAVPITNPATLHALDVRLIVSEPGSTSPRTPWPLADDGVAPADALAGDGVYGGCLRLADGDAGLTLTAVAELSERGEVYATSPAVGFEVLPAMRLAPSPGSMTLGGAGLKTGGRDCSKFVVAPPTSVLPMNPTLIVATLGTIDAGGRFTAGVADPLATDSPVTLDGLPLDASGRTTSLSWVPGAPDHEICVMAGRRAAGGVSRLAVGLAPADPLYAAAGIDGRIGVDLSLAPPSFWERWGLALLTGGLVALMAGSAAWLRRPMPMPQGLVVAVWPHGAGSRPDPIGWEAEGREVLAGMGLTLSLERDRIVARGEGLEHLDAHGRWTPIPRGPDGALDVVAGVTYRKVPNYVRITWERA